MVDGVPGGAVPWAAPWTALRAALRDRRTWLFALLGPLADIDFLFGIHSRQTHSIGAVVVVLVLAWAWAHRKRGRPDPFFGWRFAVACACAYGSHVLFDWMGNDTTPPIGIMALWPLTDGFYQSQLFVFEAISRRYWLAGFWTHNLLAVAREVVIVAPAVALLWWWRVRRARG
jgi:hypothetical protein